MDGADPLVSGQVIPGVMMLSILLEIAVAQLTQISSGVATVEILVKSLAAGHI
jgi:hypothetical protein